MALVIVDIYQQERVEVRYSKVITKYDRNDLADPNSTVKNTYSKYMDRVLSTLGFKCATTSTDGKDNNHMSVMTAIANFCEQSDPLNGTRKKIMHDHAVSILTSAELEAEVRFRAFLTSKNPAAPFPAPYLAEGSPIKTLLAKKFTQLRSILDLRWPAGRSLACNDHAVCPVWPVQSSNSRGVQAHPPILANHLTGKDTSEWVFKDARKKTRNRT